MESAIFRVIEAEGKRYIDDGAGSYTEVETPADLMAFAEEGRLPKQVLASLLTRESRQQYLDACAAIERRYTEACTANNDPCLEGGCAAEGEICLQPLLRAEVDYQKACTAEWMKLFENPANRIDAWKN